MPRVSLPEHSRAKAMRSRWFGIHVRLDLEDEGGHLRLSAASTLRGSASCARGGGA
jgi:hypothetical protein